MNHIFLLSVLLACLGCHAKQTSTPSPPKTSQPNSDNRLTFENVMKLHSGITYDQAVAVMGKPIAVDTLDDGMYVYWGKDGKKWWDKDRHIPGVRVWIENGLVRLITIHGIEVPKRPN